MSRGRLAEGLRGRECVLEGDGAAGGAWRGARRSTAMVDWGQRKHRASETQQLANRRMPPWIGFGSDLAWVGLACLVLDWRAESSMMIVI